MPGLNSCFSAVYSFLPSFFSLSNTLYLPSSHALLRERVCTEINILKNFIRSPVDGIHSLQFASVTIQVFPGIIMSELLLNFSYANQFIPFALAMLCIDINLTAYLSSATQSCGIHLRVVIQIWSDILNV